MMKRRMMKISKMKRKSSIMKKTTICNTRMKTTSSMIVETKRMKKTKMKTMRVSSIKKKKMIKRLLTIAIINRYNKILGMIMEQTMKRRKINLIRFFQCVEGVWLLSDHIRIATLIFLMICKDNLN